MLNYACRIPPYSVTYIILSDGKDDFKALKKRPDELNATQNMPALASLHISISLKS